MSQITLEKVGARIYFAGNTYPAKDRIKSLGGHWDGDRRAWWIGASKQAEAQALVDELSRPVATATPGSAAVAASVGLSSDAPAAVVADALDDAGKRGAENVRAGGTAQRDPHDVRLSGKGTYQGRSYYLGPQTRDGARVLILGLPREDDTYFERWVPAGEVQRTKEYRPREVWDGRRYSGQTRTVYTTLGSIADFIRSQKRAEERGEPACAACGKRGQLHHDLEDGLDKCYGCCDMPE